MGAVSQLERLMICNRQAEGFAAAKDKDSRYRGSKQSIDRNVIMKMLDVCDVLAIQGRALGVSGRSIHLIKDEVKQCSHLNCAMN